MRLIVDEGPALACIKVPAGCLVRNMRPMYHGTATVISGSLQDTNAWPSKNWGDGIAEQGKDGKKNMVMKGDENKTFSWGLPFPNIADWLFPRWTCKIYPTDMWNIPSGASAYSFTDYWLKAAAHEHHWFQFYGLDATLTSYNLTIDWLFVIQLKDIKDVAQIVPAPVHVKRGIAPTNIPSHLRSHTKQKLVFQHNLAAPTVDVSFCLICCLNSIRSDVPGAHISTEAFWNTHTPTL